MATIIDNLGNIPNNIPASVFRCSCENKNLLREPCALYIGTGTTQTITTYSCINEYDYVSGGFIPVNATEGTTVYLFTSNGNIVRERGYDVSGGQINVGTISGGKYYICKLEQFDVFETTTLNPPKQDGTYTLVMVVVNGKPSLTWNKV